MTYTLDPMQPQFERALAWNNDAGRMATYHRRHPLSIALEQAWMRHDQFKDAWQSIAAYLTGQTVEDMLRQSVAAL